MEEKRHIKLTNISSVLLFNLLNRDVNEKRCQFQFFAVFVTKRDATIAGPKTIYGESRLSNHILLAKHICRNVEKNKRI